jgi:hypothetical protein
MKQETTIEEAAKEFVLSHDFSQLTNPNHLANRCFQYGAKWQQEDILELLKVNGYEDEPIFDLIIEQFKKK